MKTPLRLEDLTVEQKIGQVLLGRAVVSKPENTEFALKMIKNHALCGVQIDPTPKGVEMIKMFQDAADYPLFIACDMEQGNPLGEYLIPGNFALGIVDNVEDTYNFAKATAKQAKSYGYNMMWSPVVDIRDPRCLGIMRGFGHQGERLADHATAFMKAFADCGIIGGAKHYPSANNATKYDSHMTEQTFDGTEEELREKNLYVYRRMIENLGEDMCGIMTGHTTCSKIDPDYPGTLSKKVMSIIRDYNFQGLMMTDSLAMGAIIQNFGEEDMLGLSLAAGNDMLLPNYRIPLEDSYNYLLNCYKKGLFDEARLDEAVANVLRAQERTMRQPETYELTEAEKESIARINRDCIEVITDPGVPVALSKDKKYLFVIMTENLYPSATNNSQIVGETKTVKWWKPQEIADSLLERFPGSVTKFVCEYPNDLMNDFVVANASKYDEVVFFTYCNYRAYQGTEEITRRFQILMESVQKRTSTIVHFGSPYAMEPLPHAPRRFIGANSAKCIQHVIEALCGEYVPQGKIPLELNLL
ncbi:MAG: hypothetical protein IKJ94_00330 [Oscillospiraceae bacterium]|nr:hypothetical protein [Oscillospiraceae bacterium]